MSLSLCWKTFAFSRTRVTVTPNCIPIECRWARRKGTRIAVYFLETTFHYLLNPSRYDRDRFSRKDSDIGPIAEVDRDAVDVLTRELTIENIDTR